MVLVYTALPGLMDLHAGMCGIIDDEYNDGITEKTVAASILRGIKEGERCIQSGINHYTGGYHRSPWNLFSEEGI